MGGAQQVATLLAFALKKSNHEVIIVTPDSKGELSNIKKNINIVDLETNKPIKSTKKLSDLIKSFNPDALICFGIYTGIAAALSKAIFRWTPIILIRNENNLATDWKQGSLLNKIIGPELSRLAARHAHIIAVSHSLASPTANFLRINTKRVTTILNPVLDDTKSQAYLRTTSLHPWLLDKITPIFVAMGRLEHQKGFDVLIAAFAKVRRTSNARLVIFGKGSLHDVLQAQISELQLQESVVLAGHTDSPMVQMGAATAFVLSSRFEGFGLVLVEALRAGTQVISTNCDFGPAEILENGRYGTLVPVDDEIALANAMIGILNKSLPTEYPSEAWFSQFTATKAANQHVALIESLLPNPPQNELLK